MNKHLIDEYGEVKELTSEDLKKFKPAHEGLPADVQKALGIRGPQKKPIKERITIRLSQEVVDHYRATGKGWQSRMDEDLKKVIL